MPEIAGQGFVAAWDARRRRVTLDLIEGLRATEEDAVLFLAKLNEWRPTGRFNILIHAEGSAGLSLAWRVMTTEYLVKNRSRIRVAIVRAPTQDRGLADILARETGSTIRVFETDEAAEAWITMPRETEKPSDRRTLR